MDITLFDDLSDAFDEAFFIAKQTESNAAIIDKGRYFGVCTLAHAKNINAKTLEIVRHRYASRRWFNLNKKQKRFTPPAYLYAPRTATELPCQNQAAKDMAKLEVANAILRADALERTAEFMDQMEVIFALVDHIFNAPEIATLNEARRQWQTFKRVVDESESAQAAIDTLGIEIIIHHDKNQNMVMDMWEQDRKNNPANIPL
jgi:hypothetical protein